MRRVTGQHVRGFTWFIYPDQASPGAFDGDNPFGLDPLADETTAPGVEVFWAIPELEKAVYNRALGRTYLALTENHHPPEVLDGWTVEAARVKEDCALDQNGGRWVALLRVIEQHETPEGPLMECEFEIDRF